MDKILKGDQNKDELIRKDDRMLATKVFTNAKRYSKNGVEENVSFNKEDNLIIKGDNLIVLASLLKIYEGKIKCIYIDPPYNTGKNSLSYKPYNTGKNSLSYNDSFNHYTWLIFMKNRLEIAKKMLKEDGIIFISLDDRESHYCKVLMDEIFGRDCFVREMIWLKGNAQNDAKNIQRNTESILFSISNKKYQLHWYFLFFV